LARIRNDKYYTPPDLAKYIVDKTKEVIGEENITEYIEPSAGAGVFLDYLEKENVPYLAYDIEPEDNRIIKQDFLALELEYKKGRCVIGNPPFGWANSGIKKFYKKSIQLAEYISFILPVSQYNNNHELFDFELIYSENLGEVKFLNPNSSINKKCCLNIYKKPKIKRRKPSYKFNDIKIIGWRKAKKTNCDFYICCYGSPLGKIVPRDTHHVNINGIIIYNEEIRGKIEKIFTETVWEDVYPMMSSPNLLQWQIYEHLKEKIPELE